MTQTMGTLIVLLSTGMWGISGVCGQYLFEHTQIDSTWLIAVRQILAGLMYMMVIVQRGKEPLFAIFRAQRQTLWEMLFFTFGPSGVPVWFLLCHQALKRSYSNGPHLHSACLCRAPASADAASTCGKKRKPWESLRLLWVSFLFPPMATRLALSFRRLLLFWSILSAIAMTLLHGGASAYP